MLQIPKEMEGHRLKAFLGNKESDFRTVAAILKIWK